MRSFINYEKQQLPCTVETLPSFLHCHWCHISRQRDSSEKHQESETVGRRTVVLTVHSTWTADAHTVAVLMEEQVGTVGLGYCWASHVQDLPREEPEFLWDSHTVSHCVLKTALAQTVCSTDCRKGLRAKAVLAILPFLEPIYVPSVTSSGLHGSSKSVKCPGGITKMLFHWAYNAQRCPSSTFTPGFSPDLVYLTVPGLEESPYWRKTVQEKTGPKT